MMKLRVYIGNLKHAVVLLLRLASAELLNTLVRPRPLHHQLEMGLVICLGVLWLVMEVKALLGLLPLRRKSNRDLHNIRCRNPHQDYNMVLRLLKLHSQGVMVKRLRQMDMVLNLHHPPHPQGLVNNDSTVVQADQPHLNSISRCHTQIREVRLRLGCPPLTTGTLILPVLAMLLQN
jgi:hypothetical protein